MGSIPEKIADKRVIVELIMQLDLDGYVQMSPVMFCTTSRSTFIVITPVGKLLYFSEQEYAHLCLDYHWTGYKIPTTSEVEQIIQSVTMRSQRPHGFVSKLLAVCLALPARLLGLLHHK